MKRLLILFALSAHAFAQTNTGVVIGSDGSLRPSNAAPAIRQSLFGAQPTAPLVFTNNQIRVAVGTNANTVAAGNDARITNAVQRGETVGNATNAMFSTGMKDISPGSPVVLYRGYGTWMGDLAGLAAALDATITRYASFNIPLGGNFTDFELKASVDNFTDDTNNMVFFFHSPDPAKAAIPQQRWTTRPDVFFTDSQFTGSPASRNQRYWRKQSSSQSLAAMRSNGSSVIAGALIVVRDTGAINPRNAALVWSYCRMTPTGYEEDAGGRSIWRPITPQWITQPIAP